MKLRQLARNAAFLVSHSIHQKLVVPGRLRKWRTHSEPFVHKGTRGVRLRLHPSQYIDERIYVDGVYERRFLEFLRHRIKHGGTMLDVGANIGNHALYLNDLFDQVHCFEPSSKAAARLEENIQLNRLRHVHVHRMGFGASEGSIPFSNDENLALGKFLPNDAAGEQLLPVITGDKWASDARLDRVDYIKIDVEGFEYEVLLGLSKTIAKFQPLVSFEYSGQSNNRASFSSMRDALGGYDIYEPILEPPNGTPASKAAFYLAHASTPQVVRITDAEDRYYPYLVAIPANRRDRLKLD